MSNKSPSQRYTEKLRKEGMQLYPLWVPADFSFKARLKKYKDTVEKEFLKKHIYDEAAGEWVLK